MRLVTAVLLLALAPQAVAQSAHSGGAESSVQSCVGGESGPTALASGATPFARADVRAIAEQITCYCGCPHLQVSKCFCGTADRIRGDIAGALDAGRTPDAIIAAYVAEHGTWSLAAPPKSGFNWVAWLAAPLALLTGGALVLAAGRRWAARKEPPAVVPPLLDAETDARYRAQLRRAVD